MVHVLDFEQFRDKRRSLFISFRLSDLGEFQKLCFCILCAWLLEMSLNPRDEFDHSCPEHNPCL